MTDQWRWDTLFAPGHRCQTPNLDRLADEGVAFQRAYTACPLCSPARGSLFTGLWPHQTGLMDNVGPMMYYPQGRLHLSRHTYLERLRDNAGYAISYAGKWHMGQGTLPLRGLDDHMATDGATPQSERWRPSSPPLDGETLPPYYGSYSEGVGPDQQVIERGIEQIEALAKGDGPFCAVISTWGPHFSHYVPRRYAEMYADLPTDLMPDNYIPPFTEENKPLAQSKPLWPCQNTRPLTREDWRKTCQHYWAFCTHLDEQIGRVLRLLESLGLADDTVVAFTADHGEMLGAHGAFDKGPYFYEEIMRIPMILRDPAGRSPQHPGAYVGLRDLWPTLIGLAGVEGVLSEAEMERSFWETNHDCAFYTYDAYQGREFKLRGIHRGRYKYNWSPHDMDELYDLETDPGERVNLANSPVHAGVRQALRQRLMAWMEAEGDYLVDAEHLLPVGAYIDGRGFEDQHDPGWSERDWTWFRAEG